MNSTNTKRVSEVAVGSAAHAFARSVPQPLSGSQTPFVKFPQVVGNQAMLRLLESGAVQAKMGVSQPGDADEVEADRVAAHIVSSSSAPALQRKCSCAGGGSCPACEDERNGIHRKTASPPSIQRAGADSSISNSSAQTHALSRPAHLIVEDDAPKLERGQMKKSEFLKLFKTSVTITADAALAASGKAVKSSTYIEQWLAPYVDQDSQKLENALSKYAPETARAHSAREYISLINSRVERGVITWAKTGKITGVPEELASQFSAGGGAAVGFFGALQSFASSKIGGGILGFLGGGSSKSLQRKECDGAGASGQDAASVQTQLAAGHPLDSRVQSQMSSAFGYDFSPVRVHTDSSAASLSSQLSARAFTIGKDVAFASGEYQPGTPVGDALIAHELAHVVQQGGGQASAPMTKNEGNSGQLEEDADVAAVGAVASTWAGGMQSLANLKQNAMPRLRSGLRLQRCSCSQEAAPPVKAPTQANDGKLDEQALRIVNAARDDKNPLESRATQVVRDIIHTYYPEREAKVESVVFDDEKAGTGLDILEVLGKGGNRANSKGKISVGRIFLEGQPRAGRNVGGVNERDFARRVLQVGHELDHIDQFRDPAGRLSGPKHKNEREFLAFYREAIAAELPGTGRMQHSTRVQLIDGALGYYNCFDDSLKKEHAGKQQELLTRRTQEISRSGHKDLGDPPATCRTQ